MIAPGDEHVQDAAAKLRAETALRPAAVVVLGSGLDGAVEGIEAEVEVGYDSLPGFSSPTAPGHAGRLVLGRLANAPVAAFRGRLHLYEGLPMETVTLPVRLGAALGARILVATAAVGALVAGLEAGTLVVGSSHLNFLGQNPLRGWRDDDGRPAFVDLTAAYDADLGALAVRAAEEEAMPVTTGVYAAVPGPTFETTAEAAFLAQAGGTVVGMSVIPEVCAAAALGMRTVGLFCVTNDARGPVTVDDVLGRGRSMAPGLGSVLSRILREAA